MVVCLLGVLIQYLGMNYQIFSNVNQFMTATRSKQEVAAWASAAPAWSALGIVYVIPAIFSYFLYEYVTSSWMIAYLVSHVACIGVLGAFIHALWQYPILSISQFWLTFFGT